MDLLPIEESACYRRLRDPRIVDSEPFTFPVGDINTYLRTEGPPEE